MLPVSASQIFDAANLFVLPFWVLMIFLPFWSVTQRVISSYLPFAALSVVYLYLFIGSFDPETAQALASPTLPIIAQFFSRETVAAAAWVHFLVLDLFVGRYIYLEGRRTGVWTVHSIALSLFAGPLGLLSHILTDWLSQAFTQKGETSEPAN